MKQKVKAFFTACVMLAAAVVPSAVTASAESEEQTADTVKILPLGDSITDGYWTGGAYRKYLDYALEQKGYDNIDFVGPKGSDSATFTYNGETVTYDDNNAGYSGYAIQEMTTKEYRSGILETIQETWYGSGVNMIAAYDPDIVLLQIGTNDILSAYNDGITDRLENLINVILEDMTDPGDVVFVTTIPDIDAILRADWLSAYGINAWTSTDEEKQQLQETVQGCIDTYNSSIYDLVNKLQGEGKAVRFADINSVVDYTSDLYDGVHPNEQGYENMGLYWAEVLDSYLQGKTEVPTTTEEPTTEPVTTTEAVTTTEPVTTTETVTTTEAVTTTETAEVTTVPEETTATAPATEPTSETTTEPPAEESYSVADLVRLSCFLLDSENDLTAEDAAKYDMDSSGVLDCFDAALMRKKLVSRAADSVA